MATNEILQFATNNTGTNLLTQAEYSADAQRTNGHQPGIARSKLENKVLRQASLMASGLAEFIADYQANNVTDGLTAQNISDYLVEAIKAAFPDATTTVKGKVQLATGAEVQTGTNATKAITPDSLIQRTATTTRTGLVGLATDAATQIGTETTTAVTPSSLSSRTANESRTGILSLASAAEVQAGTNTTKAITPAGLASRTASDTLAGIIRRATAAEVQTLAQNEAFITPARLPFAYVQNLSGYIKLPSGLILQWGNAGYRPANTKVAVFFPLAFPNNCLMVLAGNAYAESSDSVTSACGVQLGGLNYFNLSISGSQPQNGPTWFAIGN